MKKKILLLMGSGHRGGNTDHLSDAFRKGAEAAGHTVTKVYLGELSIGGCRGCNACRYGKPCVLRDDMQKIYPLYDECDVVVLASPLYFWTLCSSIKAFIERLYAVAEEDLTPPMGRYERYAPKESVLLMTAADDLFWTFSQAEPYYRFLAEYLGWTNRGAVLAGGCGGVSGPRGVPEICEKEAYRLGYEL
ncbi:MAG: flavodoxin family protein [Clostridiales bacterium]|nr:flavodoxin family protein [Clostridiales bacterium]